MFEGGHLFFLQDPRAFKQIEAFLLGKNDFSTRDRQLRNNIHKIEQSPIEEKSWRLSENPAIHTEKGQGGETPTFRGPVLWMGRA